MDVRCPSCRTEYELDESRLRPGGVTVKCAECTHVFRVRKRGDTLGGNSTARRNSDEERSWLVRLHDGEIKVCRELATLQRWIVSGTISPECEISRTGKKWKELKEIKELSSFFAIAAEAKDIASGKKPLPPAPKVADGTAVVSSAEHRPEKRSRPHTISRDSGKNSSPEEEELDSLEDDEVTVEMSPAEAKAAIEAARYGPHDAPTPEIPDVEAIAPGALEEGSIDTAAETTSNEKPGAEKLATTISSDQKKTLQRPVVSPSAQPKSITKAPPRPPTAKPSVPPPRQAATSRAPSIPPPAPKARKGGGSPSWADGGPKKLAERGSASSSGPVGGLAKSVPTTEAAFARGGISSIKKNSDTSFSGKARGEILPTRAPAKPSRVGTWIVVISLIAILGAAFLVYYTMVRKPDAAIVASSETDGGPPVDATIAIALDDSDADAATASSSSQNKVDIAVDRFDIDTLLEVDEELASRSEGFEKNLDKAKIQLALSQLALDASIREPKKAILFRRRSRNAAAAALAPAKTALALRSDSPDAQLARADAARLSNAPTKEVERWLRKVPEGAQRTWVEFGLRLRDKRMRDAESLLPTVLEETTARAQSRALVLAAARNDAEALQSQLDAMEQLYADHPLILRWDEKAEILQSKPTEPVVATQKDPDKNVPSGDTKPMGNTANNAGQGGGEGYDILLERADKAAEAGNCGQGMKLYSKALDKNPSGVAALTGLGYCHLDGKNYSSAQAKFRAALGISRRYQDALWGVAEGYQQQSLKSQAIAGYRKFIDEHPTSRRSEMAKRQIERLGGSVGGETQDKPEKTPDADQGTGSEIDEAKPVEPSPVAPTP